MNKTNIINLTISLSIMRSQREKNMKFSSDKYDKQRIDEIKKKKKSVLRVNAIYKKEKKKENLGVIYIS